MQTPMDAKDVWGEKVKVLSDNRPSRNGSHGQIRSQPLHCTCSWIGEVLEEGVKSVEAPSAAQLCPVVCRISPWLGRESSHARCNFLGAKQLMISELDGHSAQ